ncbi:MAG: flagellar hook-basal body complex protein [Eubacterium sp.]|nr:flagellar hook-basal body complex protein [Eubacterium sp.]
MMRSLYSGVSGLKTHQTKMDVIGNNIANVNTTAYKSMSINFSELMYQTTQAASAPSESLAGTNPKQIGLGVQSAAISTKVEGGATQTTGNPFDLKINGDEFFIVSDGSQTYFTRDGSFYVDADGNLAMSSTGYKVMGWQAEEADDGTLQVKKDTVSPLVVMDESNKTYAAEYTKAAVASGIVDWFDENQSDSAGNIVSLQFYDNLGYSYTAKFSMHNGYKPTTTKEDYTFYVELEGVYDSNGKLVTGSDNLSFGSAQSNFKLTGETYGVQNYTVNKKEVALAGGTTTTTIAYVNYSTTTGGTTTTTSVILYPADLTGLATPLPGTPTQLFKADGTVDPANADIFKALYGTNIDATAIQSSSVDPTSGTLTVTGKNITSAAVLTYSGTTGELISGKSYNLDLSSLGDAFTTIEIDFTKTSVSDNDGSSTVALTRGNTSKGFKGRELGTLQGVSIQSNGMIYASYSNGQTKLLGQIAVAEFANASGLQKEGENLYSQTNNSGEFNGIGIDISSNGDAMTTGTLEMSNVDLSSEFTEMITTQRGYQANSRIITVSDTLLEELVNLKR